MPTAYQVMRNYNANVSAPSNGVGAFINNISAVLSDPVDNAFTSLLNKWTGAGLTGEQVAQNQFNAEQAQIQRDYETEMSNTIWQRGVADMQSAGINPALAYSQGGASTPSGATATAAAGSNGMSFQEAISAAMLPMQIKQMQANTIKTIEDTKSVQAEREKTIAEINNVKATLDEIRSRTDLNDTQQSNLLLIGSWLDRQQDAALRKTESEIKFTDSQRKKLEELLPLEKTVQIKTIDDLVKHIDFMQRQIEKTAAETDLLYEDIANYALNHSSNGWLGTGLSLQNILRLIQNVH